MRHGSYRKRKTWWSCGYQMPRGRKNWQEWRKRGWKMQERTCWWGTSRYLTEAICTRGLTLESFMGGNRHLRPWWVTTLIKGVLGMEGATVEIMLCIIRDMGVAAMILTTSMTEWIQQLRQSEDVANVRKKRRPTFCHRWASHNHLVLGSAICEW